MCHNRATNKKINSFHERCFRILYNNPPLHNYCKDRSVSMHHVNLRKLAIETFNIKIKLSPPIVRELFNQKINNYNLRYLSAFDIDNAKGVIHGTESISFLGPAIWSIIATKFKELNSLISFKKVIKKFQSILADYARHSSGISKICNLF